MCKYNCNNIFIYLYNDLMDCILLLHKRNENGQMIYRIVYTNTHNDIPSI